MKLKLNEVIGYAGNMISTAIAVIALFVAMNDSSPRLSISNRSGSSLSTRLSVCKYTQTGQEEYILYAEGNHDFAEFLIANNGGRPVTFMNAYMDYLVNGRFDAKILNFVYDGTNYDFEDPNIGNDSITGFETVYADATEIDTSRFGTFTLFQGPNVATRKNLFIAIEPGEAKRVVVWIKVSARVPRERLEDVLDYYTSPTYVGQSVDVPITLEFSDYSTHLDYVKMEILGISDDDVENICPPLVTFPA